MAASTHREKGFYMQLRLLTNRPPLFSSVKEANMKTQKDAMTCCQGECSQNFGGYFTFVGPYEPELMIITFRRRV